MHVTVTSALQEGFKNAKDEYRCLLIRCGETAKVSMAHGNSGNVQLAFELDHIELKKMGQNFLAVCSAIFNELDDKQVREMLYARFKARIKVGDVMKTPSGHATVKRVKFDYVTFDSPIGDVGFSMYDLWEASHG